MIFEFWIDPDAPQVYDEYLRESAMLRRHLEGSAGFVEVERFESTAEPGKFVAIGFFTDEEAVTRWRTAPEHRRVQALGQNVLFTRYRLRMAQVTRDYSSEDRLEAPRDSRAWHASVSEA